MEEVLAQSPLIEKEQKAGRKDDVCIDVIFINARSDAPESCKGFHFVSPSARMSVRCPASAAAAAIGGLIR